MQGFFSHCNVISISGTGKFLPHLVQNFIRVKFAYTTMIFSMNHITALIIFTFLNNIFMANKIKIFLEKPAKV
jgi:hypothetical protein